MTSTAVILAAGLGSRLAGGGESEEYSKPLMQVAGKTLLERTVVGCRAAGMTRILVVTGFRAPRVEDEVARIDGGRGDLETVHNPAFARQNGLSLLVCRAALASAPSFALMMADHVFEPGILADLVAAPLPEGAVRLAVDRKIDRVYDLDDATKVWIETGAAAAGAPSLERIARIGKHLDPFNAVDVGLFHCRPAIFEALDQASAEGGGDCSLSQGMQRIGQRGLFLPFDIGERLWQDVDTPEMLGQAVRLVE